MLKLFKLN